MASAAVSWRVALESVECLDRPQYRVGDVAKRAVNSVQKTNSKIKNIIVELTSPVSASGKSRTQVSRPFDVDNEGSGKVGQALLMPVPLKGKPLVCRVLMRHSVQADALIGEASVSEAAGKINLELVRKGKPRGTLLVDVTAATRALNAPGFAASRETAAKSDDMTVIDSLVSNHKPTNAATLEKTLGSSVASDAASLNKKQQSQCCNTCFCGLPKFFLCR